ncbi:MAG TPA: hypothetical protein ENG31_02960 [Candidatus Thorarchaeota archaeon]|nr:MAG: hypothetical protein DRO73_01025 [Candidatus Thorarchaeota archaeon]RLI62499.1 MAG: hypothetical protein DRO93_01200 [Candidatus Thorarchaeota archaeon]HDD67563.1 hypothetical protein [Candidatus Thorarchaeota archaeon]
MNLRVLRVACVVIAAMIVIAPSTGKAAVTGQTYRFVAHWLDQTWQQNDGPLVTSDVYGEFVVHVWNISQQGGDDVIMYNYKGWALYLNPMYVEVNDSVAFQDNKVYWTLQTFDSDGDNRSESAAFGLHPNYSPYHPGHYLFVNPIWSTHETNWNQAVADTENNSCVDQGTFTHSAADGRFSFSITVSVEETQYEMNGTYTYKLSAQYDDDGVLTSMRYDFSRSMSRANLTIESTTTFRVERVTTPIAPTTGFNLETNIPLMYVALIAPACVIVGLLIGKKVFG